ncbi:TcpE family conjugal transfer membrane protein [Actinomadura sp. 6N118]|uniref:TcpE family conjugal transfer membrane protein n=1 Tax=Actinomadura sp. 6N118 TaxID=3375151 RepID=UPI0037884AF7
MDLPTYTNIWRIEKRLYKLYDLRLPMPLPLVQIGVFAGVFVPWILLLLFVGIPFESPWHVVYIVPPGVLTWLSTRPVIEGKRLTELLISQGRYVAEPRTWCRLTPIREPREVVIVARVWRRPEAPAPVAAPERAAIKSRRKARKAKKTAQPVVQEVTVPTAASLLPGPALVDAPQPLAEYAAQHPNAQHVPPAQAALPMPVQQTADPHAQRVSATEGAPQRTGVRRAAAENGEREPALAPGTLGTEHDVRVAGPAPERAPVRTAKPWRRTTREIAHEDDVQVVAQEPADIDRPPATPQLEVPPAHEQQPAEEPVGSGKRALASGVRRPGAAAEFWKAINQPAETQTGEASATPPASATRPDIQQQRSSATRPDIPQTPATPPATRPDIPKVPGAFGTGTAEGDTEWRPAKEQPAAERPAEELQVDVTQPAGDEGPHREGETAGERSAAPNAGASDDGAREAAKSQAQAEESAGTEPETPASESRETPSARASRRARKGQPAEGWPGAVPWPHRAQQPQGEQEPPRAQEAGSVQQPQQAQGQEPDQAAPSARPEGASGAEAGQEAQSAEEPQVGQEQRSEQAPLRGRPEGVPDAQAAQPSQPVGDEARAGEGSQAGREQTQQPGQGEVQAGAQTGREQQPKQMPQRGQAQAGEGSQAGREQAQQRGQARAGERSGAVSDADRQAGRAQGGPQAGQGPWRAHRQESDAGRQSGPGAEQGVPERGRQPQWGQQPRWGQGAQAEPEMPAASADEQTGEGARREPPKPWSKGLSKPVRASATDALVWPPGASPRREGPETPQRFTGPPPRPPQGTPVKPPVVPAEQTPPPREVRSGPASPVRPRPLPPPPAAPPSEPAITPPGPDHEVSTGGLRRLIQAVGGGHGEADAEYEARLQQPFHGTRHIVVLGCTGGAGQTVTALMLGHTFAQHNGEPVVAIDVNPGPGALARRTRSETNETLTGLITRADQVNSLTAMRRYTSQAKSGLDVIAAGRNPLQALDDRDYALAIRTIDRFYSVTLLDTAAAVVARVLPYADQIVLVAPASSDAPRAVSMTFEWLDGHGYDELRSRAVTVINGVSRRSMDDVEQAEAVARGRCRALVRIPWDDHLSMDRAPRNELKSLRAPTRRAYLALAGVVAGGFTVMPERYQELQEQEQEATR